MAEMISASENHALRDDFLVDLRMGGRITLSRMINMWTRYL